MLLCLPIVGGHEIGDPVDHPTATNKPRSFTDLYMSPPDYINVVSQFMVNSPLEKLIGQLPTSIDTLPICSTTFTNSSH